MRLPKKKLHIKKRKNHRLDFWGIHAFRALVE